MNYTEPKVIYTCFPGGKHKVLTMSYDDGRLEDRRLVELFNRYGIRGTFNLNGGLPRPERIPESEWVELYKGHEVACHTYHHPTISRSPLDQTARQELAQQDKFTLKLVNDQVDTCADALYQAICQRIGAAE